MGSHLPDCLGFAKGDSSELSDEDLEEVAGGVSSDTVTGFLVQLVGSLTL